VRVRLLRHPAVHGHGGVPAGPGDALHQLRRRDRAQGGARQPGRAEQEHRRRIPHRVAAGQDARRQPHLAHQDRRRRAHRPTHRVPTQRPRRRAAWAYTRGAHAASPTPPTPPRAQARSRPSVARCARLRARRRSSS
jgi:hypothetical protein